MDNNLEWGLLICLFKATVEQQSMLIGQTKQEAKMIFNRWLREGDRLLKIIEKNSDLDKLENVTEQIENCVNDLRKQHGL